MNAIPPLVTPATLPAWRADPTQWRGVVREIARRHGLPHARARPFETGTNLVAALDDHLVLKAFPPFHRAQFQSERLALKQLAGRTEVAIPAIVHEGVAGDWSYLVLTRLGGVVGSLSWPLASEADKEVILQQLGEAIAQVQAAPLGPLAALEPSWPKFLEAQIAGCRARHMRLGLPLRYLSGLDEWLDDAADILPADFPPVILTGEYIPENFLLTQTSRGWRLTGLIDFGDVMTGFGEYDLLGPSAFLAEGRGARVRRLLRGFGLSDAQMNVALARRLLLLMMLHRASDPIRHIAIGDWRERTADLDDLQRLLWPLDESSVTSFRRR